MYLKQHNLVFVHIPKCAGTSIEKALFEYSGEVKSSDHFMGKNHNPLNGPPRLDHLTAEKLRGKLSKANIQWNDLNSFAITRCPWSRLVSEYNWRGVSRLFRLKNNRDWTFREYVLENFPTKLSDNFVRCYDSYTHVRPQSDFTHDSKNNLIVDKVIDIKKVNTDLVTYLNSIGIDIESFPKTNKSEFRDPKSGKMTNDKLPLESYFDDETSAFVESYYKRDIANFEYPNPLN